MGLECPFKSNSCLLKIPKLKSRLGICQDVGRRPGLGNQSRNLGVGAHPLEAVDMPIDPGLGQGRHFRKEKLHPCVEVFTRVHRNAEIGGMQVLGGTNLQFDGRDDGLEIVIDGRFIVRLICGEDLCF